MLLRGLFLSTRRNTTAPNLARQIYAGLTANSGACTLSRMAKKKFVMWLDTDQIKTLKALSKKTGIPMSVLIRRGVDWTIKKHAGK